RCSQASLREDTGPAHVICSLGQYYIVYQGSQVHRHRIGHVAGKTAAVPEFPPCEGFHRDSHSLESRNGARLGMEKAADPHTHLDESHMRSLCRQPRSCQNICPHSKERNARTITTAMEPRPAPTICCSVSDESVGQNHTLNPRSRKHRPFQEHTPTCAHSTLAQGLAPLNKPSQECPECLRPLKWP
ncbi:hypothetical protein MC885_015970, partial [Smutsia gigantea]